MKRTNKLTAVLCVALCLCMILAACGPKEQSPSTPSSNGGGDTVYTVTVKTAGGMALKGVTIYIYDNATDRNLLCYDNLDKEGKYTFTAKASDQYIAVLENVPEGYGQAESYPLTSENTEIVLTPSVITGQNPTDKVYKNGDVMRDFTVTDTDGVEHTLSEILKTKKAVVLNFWFVNCGPCKDEFPYLNEAYEKFKDDIEVLAMNFTDDSEESIAALKEKMKLNFPMIKCEEAWRDAMSAQSTPTTVIIDRYGVICLRESEAVTNPQVFDAAFTHFAAEDYKQKFATSMEDLMGEAPIGSSRNPAILDNASTEFDAAVTPKGKYHTMVYRAERVILRIECKDVYVMYNETRFDPDENGLIEVELHSPDTFSPAYFVICSNIDKEVTVHATLIWPDTSAHPAELGELKFEVSSGMEMGKSYVFKTDKAGKLSLTILDAPEGVSIEALLYNDTSYVTQYLSTDSTTDEEGHLVINIDVKPGEEILIRVYANADEETGEIPSFVVKTELSFAEA